MKKSKVLVPALAMICVSTAAAVTGTVAWFAANKTVTATGMKVKAETEGSLVISNALISDTNYKQRTVDFGSELQSLYCSTHKDASATKLSYVSNPEDIDETTGLPLEGKTATFADAVNGTEEGSRQYYKDYVVFVAAQSSNLTADLTISLIQADGSAMEKDETNVINNAISVDFYCKEAAAAPEVSDTFLGTLNIAGQTPSDSAVGAAKTEISTTGVSIPKVGSAADYALLMRVYVDGALRDTATTTYCKNIDAAKLSEVEFGVKIVASNTVVVA